MLKRINLPAATSNPPHFALGQNATLTPGVMPDVCGILQYTINGRKPQPFPPAPRHNAELFSSNPATAERWCDALKRTKS